MKNQNEKHNKEETLEGVFEARAAVEAMLLASDGPLEHRRIELVLGAQFDDWIIDRAIGLLKEEYQGSDRGIHLEEVAGGLQLRTNPRYGYVIAAMVAEQPAKLSQSAMETLAIVAYRQPVIRSEIEQVRGVDSSGMLRKLLDYELIEVVGRADELGRPNLYGTTTRFLEFFGLSSVGELPSFADGDMEILFGRMTEKSASEQGDVQEARDDG